MSKVRQIDYTTPRTLVSLNGRRIVRMTGGDSRYQFAGELVGGEENDRARIGDVRPDWQKSAFPVPWTDSPDLVRATESVPVLVFGEVLYDCFPDGRRVLGGAPFNVAWHLKGLGCEPVFLSAVGGDADGRAIRSSMQDWGMDVRGLQIAPDLATGTVEVSLEKGEPHYAISSPRAWDTISDQGLRAARVLYHGSLACRDPRSRAALEEIRNASEGLRFVDLNLRPPHYEIESVRDQVRGADWLKLSLAELAELAGVQAPAFSAVEGVMEGVCGDLGIGNLLVTAGAEGACLVGNSGRAKVGPAPQPAELVDTVGAGDAFSAVAIKGILEGWDSRRLLETACCFAARVCGLRGATTPDRTFYNDEGACASS